MSQQYTPEFKKKLVKLVVEEDKSYYDVAREYGLPNSTINTWLRQARTNPEALEKTTSMTKGVAARKIPVEQKVDYVTTLDELLKLKKRVNELETENYRLQKLNNILLDKVI